MFHFVFKSYAATILLLRSSLRCCEYTTSPQIGIQSEHSLIYIERQFLKFTFKLAIFSRNKV